MVNHVRNQNFTKNGSLKSYNHRIWNFLERFNAFPEKKNRHANRLEIVGASYYVPRILEDEKK